MITQEEFIKSLENTHPPLNLAPHIQALWYDAKGDWSKAHSLIDDLDDPKSSHVHAYLHRKEGDLWNADYWYRKAGQNRPEFTLAEEWEQLVQLELKDNSAKTH